MAETPHRCLVMVHGIGTQQRGRSLSDVGEPLATYLAAYVSAECAMDVNADVAPVGGSEADARLQFADGDERRELRLHEAWWTARFAPPGFSPTVLWTLGIFWSQLVAIAIGLVLPDRSPVPSPAAQPCTHPDDASVYQLPPRSALARLYDFWIGLALLAVFVAGSGLVFAALLLAWLFDGLYALIRLDGLGAIAAGLREKVFTQHVSQVYIYLNSNLARASIRAAAEDVLRPLLTLQHRHQERCEGLTIVAHSWGAVVALDALRTLAHDADVDQRELTLITVGSALNRARALKPEDPLWEEFRTGAAGILAPAPARWCGRWRWINLWARFDPVPAGPIASELRQALSVPDQRLHDVRVSNLDDPIGDHTAYWANVHEVMSRIVFEANGRPSSGRTAAAVCSGVGAIASRRRAVGLLSIGRLIAIIGGAALLVLLFVASNGLLRLASLVAPGPLALYVVLVHWRSGRPLGANSATFWIGLLALVGLGGVVALTDAAGTVYTAWSWLNRLAVPANVPPVVAGIVPLIALYKLLRFVVLNPALTTLPTRAGQKLPAPCRVALSRSAFTWNANRWR